LYGGAGNDVYYVDSVNDDVFEAANGGTLDIVIGSVSYTLDAGVQVEDLRTSSASATTALNLNGNEFAQILRGNSGANKLNGKGGADDMYGGAGNDTYYVDDAGDDVFEAPGGGALDIVVSTVSYRLDAGVEVEDLRTNSASATGALNLTGNEFGQTIRGNAGANILNGKGGADMLIGGAGRDTFVFDSALGASNVDRIDDFEAAGSVDTIRLDQTIFTALTVGALAASAFRIGSAAADGSDRIIYDSVSGSLFYDRDGTGSAAAIRFAILDDKLAMTTADFAVVA